MTNTTFPLLFRSWLYSFDNDDPSFEITTTLSAQVCISILLIILFTLPFYHRKKRANSLSPPPFVPKLNQSETANSFSTTDKLFNFLQIISKADAPVLRLRSLFLGPCLPNMAVIINDAYLLRQICNDKTCTKTSKYYAPYTALFRSCGGKEGNIFTSEGLPWIHARKSTSVAFSSSQLKRMKLVAQNETNHWIEHRIKPLVEKNEPFDPAQECLHLTLSTICKAAFEYDISEQERDEFLTELEISLLQAAKWFMPLYSTLFIHFDSSVKRARLATQRLRKICQNILTTYRDNFKSGSLPYKGTVLDCIVNDDKYHDDEERLNDILVFLIGGHDSTAFTLAWTLLELAKHPEEQEKLYSSLTTNNDSFNMEDMENMEGLDMKEDNDGDSNMLRNVLKEGMRLHPVASAGPARTNTKDIIVKQQDGPDICIPSGSTILLYIYAILRSPKYYTDPDKFQPSRWNNPSKDENAAFLPFLVGRRNCVGQNLANSTLSTALAQICTAFELSVVEEGSPICFFTLKPSGVRLMAKYRSTCASNDKK